MTTTTTPATIRQFGRCPAKGCKTRIVLDPATDTRVKVQRRNGKTVAVEVDAPPRTDLGHGAVVHGGGDVYCATKHGHGEVCGSSYERIRWQGIKATLNHMDCGPQCWGATGADCKCSCGGARHGELA